MNKLNEEWPFSEQLQHSFYSVILVINTCLAKEEDINNLPLLVLDLAQFDELAFLEKPFGIIEELGHLAASEPVELVLQEPGSFFVNRRRSPLFFSFDVSCSGLWQIVLAPFIADDHQLQQFFCWLGGTKKAGIRQLHEGFTAVRHLPCVQTTD